MCVYVCMYTCVEIRGQPASGVVPQAPFIHLQVCVCSCVLMCMCVIMCVDVHMNTCVYSSTIRCVCSCVWLYTWIHMYTCAFTWRSKDNFGYHSSGTHYIFVWHGVSYWCRTGLIRLGAGDRAQWLRVLAAHTEDPTPTRSLPTVCHYGLRDSSALFWPPWASGMHVVYICTTGKH